MNEPATGISARMWLLMLREGGLWTAGELKDALDFDRATISTNLTSMAEGHSVRKQKAANGVNVKFSVTADCVVPRGVPLADILACNLHRLEPGA